MCTIIVARNQLRRVPLAVAHARDELLSRPWRPPARLGAGVLAPRDELALGTWVGVNEHGLVVAVTNRIAGPRVTPEDGGTLPRSRGQLCLDALTKPSVEAALDALRPHLERTAYQGFNLLLADRGRAVVLMREESLSSEVALEDGVHVITSMDHVDPPALAPLRAELGRRAQGGLASYRRAVTRALASHEPLPTNYPSCKHMGPYGTASSTLVWLDGAGARMEFAAGPPCRTPYREVHP